MKIISILSIASVLAVTLSCGGGGNSGSTNTVGSGGSGGGGATPPQITIVSPSVVMSDVYVGSVNLTGTGFTPTSQVLLDGSPVQTIAGTSTTTEGTLPGGLSLGVHQISVQNGSQFGGKVMIDVSTPDALQSDTISDGNGNLIPNPQAAFDSGQAFGPN